MSNLVRRHAPQHDILEEPCEYLAMDRRERRELPEGGKPAVLAGSQRWRAKKLAVTGQCPGALLVGVSAT